MNNVNSIEEVKEIFKLADPAFDFRKDDSWDLTDMDRLKRGVGAELVIDIGKSDGEDSFISWLTSRVINPIVKVRETHLTIKTRMETILLLDWDSVIVKQIKTISDDCLDYTDYVVVLGADSKDYQLALRVNKELQKYCNYI
ncbi:hypothetical protein [Ruminococcus albus]|uniref:Uncharacterized protein n=1 Tax=Ruminococcus albus (strain ATCC 27210 / DSM 20455 / JCM 14654 / NCDO 2250 / 7) TaxID=697329 RepID=E6UEV5_RUMA7|nr:hypothetical protein [Ruminococcus albus]ADU22954.1 hypothetical protein Rumal_2474 [Ruminococcus albus 7 = DSM 20455]